MLWRVLCRLGPCDVLCHSLGSRVVNQALKWPATQVERVIYLNGADYAKNAREAAIKNPQVEFHNFTSRSDDVLSKLGRWAAPGPSQDLVGNPGLTLPRPDNVTEYDLDDPRAKVWAMSKGWEGVAADNPDGYGDHWYTFENRKNWPVFRDILGA